MIFNSYNFEFVLVTLKAKHKKSQLNKTSFI